MVATFVVEEITWAGRTASKKISNGIKRIEPFIGGPKVARPIDKFQNWTINLGVRASAAVVPKAFRFWHFARIELRPPRIREMPQVTRGFQDLISGAKTGKWKTVTTKEALVNTCVTIEVLCWFFIGECFGKGHLIGYQYPGAVWMELDL